MRYYTLMRTQGPIPNMDIITYLRKFMKKMYLVKFSICVFFVSLLTACNTVKPVWPAPYKSQIVESLISNNPSKISIRVEPIKKAYPLANSSARSLSKQLDPSIKIAQVLDVMALDRHIDKVIIADIEASLDAEVISVSDLINQQNQKIESERERVQSVLQSTGGSEATAELLSLLVSQSKVNYANQAEDEARVLLRYGLSEGGNNVGISARIVYNFVHDKVGKLKCEDEIFVLENSGLTIPTDSDGQHLSALVARDFHLTRKSFHTATRRISQILVDYLTLDLPIYATQTSNNTKLSKNAFITNFITHDGTFLENVSAVRYDIGSMIGYKFVENRRNKLCPEKLVVLGSSWSSHRASEQRWLDQQREADRAKQNHKLKQFAERQELRNKRITFKRLGLEHK